jgi:hemerythrin
MVTWQDSLSTSDERTDSQHKVLIEQFNQLEEIMNTSTAGSFRQAAGEVLDFLQFYAAWHFEEEEKLMAGLNCTLAAENKKQHAEFLAMFNDFYAKWQTSKMDLELARSTYKVMSNWIVNHIIQVDTHIKDCQ